MSSNLFSFESLSKSHFPSKIILDTNFILNLTHEYTHHPTSKNVIECSNFLKSLIWDESEIFIPQIVINEFCHQVFLNVLSEYMHNHNLKINRVDLYKAKPYLIAPGHHQVKEVLKMLDKIISKTILKEMDMAVQNTAIKIMEKYNLFPSDAFIGAIAIENNIRHIATLDVYFAKNIVKEGVSVYLPEILLPRK